MSATAIREAGTPTASRAADARPAGRDRRCGWAGLLLLAAVAAGLLGQGAYHTAVRWQVGVLVAVLARLVERPGSLPLVLAASGLLAGLGATLSRTGALALVAGLLVLALLGGFARLLGRWSAVGWGPGRAGRSAAVDAGRESAAGGGGAGRPCRRAGRCRDRGSSARPQLGRCAAGCLRRHADRRRRDRRRRQRGRGGGGDAHHHGLTRPGRRGPCRPPSGGGASLAGPGRADLRWKGQDGVTRVFVYAHNEYVQVAAELGLVGLALLAVLLVSLARLLWRTRATTAGAVWAGVVAATAAFAVHSGFDFVWHLPAVVLTVCLLAGLVLPTPDSTAAGLPAIASTKGER